MIQSLCKNRTICLENFKNITFRKVDVAPRKESGRTIAAFADCFHFSGCKGVVEVDSCRTSGSHDDPMNVHGTHLKITGIEDDKLTLHFMHHQTYGFKTFLAGDSVAFVRPENLLIQGDYCRWIYPTEAEIQRNRL